MLWSATQTGVARAKRGAVKQRLVLPNVTVQLPYINTTLLINELINLHHEETTSGVRILRSKGKRKDRYSSLSYSYYVACQLESKIRRRSSSSKDGADLLFRAPKIK